MSNESLKERIKKYNREVHRHEDEVYAAALSEMERIQMLDADATLEAKQHLQGCLQGILSAKNKYELDLYQQAISIILQNILCELELRKHIEELCATRSAYLPDGDRYWPLLMNFSWMAIGTAMIVVGFIFTSGIAAFVLGILGIVYGVADLVQFLYGPLANLVTPTIGKREPDNDHFDKEKAFKIIKRVVLIALGVIALAAMVAAIAFPPIGLPMAIIGVVTAVITTVFYAYKIYKNYQAKRSVDDKFMSLKNKYAVPEKKGDDPAESLLPSEVAAEQPSAVRVAANTGDDKRFKLFASKRAISQTGASLKPNTQIRHPVVGDSGQERRFSF